MHLQEHFLPPPWRSRAARPAFHFGPSALGFASGATGLFELPAPDLALSRKSNRMFVSCRITVNPSFYLLITLIRDICWKCSDCLWGAGLIHFNPVNLLSVCRTSSSRWVTALMSWYVLVTWPTLSEHSTEEGKREEFNERSSLRIKIRIFFVASLNYESNLKSKRKQERDADNCFHPQKF